MLLVLVAAHDPARFGIRGLFTGVATTAIELVGVAAIVAGKNIEAAVAALN